MYRPFVLAASSVLLAFATSAAAHDECLITFGVGTTTKLTTVWANAYYQDAPGEFDGSGSTVNCQSLNNYLVSKQDVDAERKLMFSLITFSTPISGPKDLLRCKWLPTSRWPVAEDFDLSEQEGQDEGFNKVDAQVRVSSIECESVTTTTIATTTTTTLPEVLCGDFNGDDEVQASDALGVLRTSVETVACPLCVCDLDGNGTVFVSDALMALKLSVGAEVTTNCSGC